MTIHAEDRITGCINQTLIHSTAMQNSAAELVHSTNAPYSPEGQGFINKHQATK